ncbi:helix-turn-helix domain-containing protein [Caballeronia sp. dw_276]|jgi:DNA-binding HxlR family transcriptional regulator|uniref:winged helix-turn-helix transcriptional regulator n=1 Tax=Caballeronia sp. dw_276 TaxID=2719795 RepID=UPI001BD42419|nr:helix-turn-helix domain-containing protein [Caballeronia sp. dw_276]
MNSNIEMTAGAVPLSELVRRGELLSADCPSREVLKHVTSRWGVLVLMVLLDEETCRFSDLRRKVDGVSEKMLAQTLQWLAADGFVVRTSYDVVPPHVDYRLTPLGKEIAQQVSALADWIEVNLSRIMNARNVPDGESN